MQFTAWSHSRLSLWNECPLRAKFKHLDKLKEPDHPAAERGTRIHTGMENWLKDPVQPAPVFDLPSHFEPPRALDKFYSCATELKAQRPVVEQEWAYTSAWKPTGWFAKDAWFRQKMDAGAAMDGGYMIAIDWKTGKPWGDGKDQMELTAVSIFARYYDVQEVDTRLWYLDSGEEIPATFYRKQFAELRDKWTKRASVMLADTTLAPRPGRHCSRCHFRSSNNGPCKFG